MSIDLNDEILQDFLVEAGEILEQLNEQLVDLEQSPEDGDLNSIFRGFHTIKGGASFLSLTNLVEICHKAEDVFNLLRNDELALDANMMDAFLRVLDEVNAMFEQIRSGEDPAAPPELIQQLLANAGSGSRAAATERGRRAEAAKSEPAETRRTPKAEDEAVEARPARRQRSRRRGRIGEPPRNSHPAATKSPTRSSKPCSIRCTAPGAEGDAPRRRIRPRHGDQPTPMKSPTTNSKTCSTTARQGRRARQESGGKKPPSIRPLRMKSPTMNSKPCSTTCTARAKGPGKKPRTKPPKADVRDGRGR